MSGTQGLMGGRVGLSPRPLRARAAALEAGMLGHLPGPVRLARLRADARALMREVGLGEALDHLEEGPSPRLPAEDLLRVRALEHLPIPILSAAELDDIFPEARTQATLYGSRLAGRRAWLPQAVDDFFANGGERLWLVRIPESQAQSGFLPGSALAGPDARPDPGADLPLHESLALRGLATLLPIPELGVVCLPDLERLQIASGLSDIPPLELESPEPRFVPCTQVREPPAPSAASGPAPGAPLPDPVDTLSLIGALAGALARWRPDMALILGIPLAWEPGLGSPGPDMAVLSALDELRATQAGAGLRRVQLLYPYLRGPRLGLASASGLVAGAQAGVARRDGHWRSAAGRPLVTDARPYPVGPSAETLSLRERPGVGVLVYRGGAVELDDERLAVPALHRDDWQGAGDPARFDGYRSGEVGRFLGYLMRELRALGESLVFDADPDDPRPRLALDAFFRRLFAAGALRGRAPEEAYRIAREARGEGVLAYAIELAPAFPVDRIRLTFVNRDGEWQAHG